MSTTVIALGGSRAGEMWWCEEVTMMAKMKVDSIMWSNEALI